MTQVELFYLAKQVKALHRAIGEPARFPGCRFETTIAAVPGMLATGDLTGFSWHEWGRQE